VSPRLALLLAALFGVLVLLYLTTLNPAGVRDAVAGPSAYDLPLMALLAGAFLVGGTLGLVLGMLRDVGRTYRDHRRARRAREDETLDETYHRGMEAQLAGRLAEAAHAYEEVLRREPAHRDATIRLGELARQRGDIRGALNHHLHALETDDRVETLLATGDDHRTLGRIDDAIRMYQRVLARDPGHVTALRALRDVAARHGRWSEALQAEERLIRVVPGEDRAAEEAWLAGIQYELGRLALAAGDAASAASRFRDALRTRHDFMPAALTLGDAHLKMGDTREALRVWERALEKDAIPPLLTRIGEVHRAEGRPARLISLHQDTAARHPDSLAAAFGLGRAYFELAMLDEAAEQFQKIEVQAPDLPAIHAYLGAIFERHGQIREAFEEYRRALRFPGSFEWPHRCAACSATQPSWFDRCPSCRRWNTSRP
jgi:lipopolysaccharide biosynthesis regulator YciM